MRVFYKKPKKKTIKVLIKSTLFFVGLMLSSFAAESGPFHYEAPIITTPDMHSVTAKISMEDLKNADYDLSKFTVDVQLPNEDEAVDAFLKNRLFKDNWQSMKEDQHNIYLHSEPLKKYILTFLKIEAEAIFYRDLASKMQSHHSELNSNQLYRKHLSSNAILFEGLLDITAGKGEKADLDSLSSMLISQGIRKRQGGYMFEKFLLSTEGLKPSTMLEKAKKVKEEVIQNRNN